MHNAHVTAHKNATNNIIIVVDAHINVDTHARPNDQH